MGRKDPTSFIISLLAMPADPPSPNQRECRGHILCWGVIIVALSVEAPIEKGGVVTPLKALRPGFADEWVSDLISCLKGI